jgi:hypothetical protein
MLLLLLPYHHMHHVLLQVRAAGGIEVLAAALGYLASPSSSSSSADNTQLAVSLLHCLARLVEGNPASRLGLREAWGLAAAAGLLQQALDGLAQQQQQQQLDAGSR